MEFIRRVYKCRASITLDIFKYLEMLRRILALGLFIGAVASLSLVAAHQDGYEHEFCWKDTYGRGVGTIPSSCPSTKDKIGLLCYDKCPDGMKRSGFDCHSTCPSSWSDQGLFCRLSEYGRGSGYPWKFGDPTNSKKQYKRCENDHGKGNCQKDGAIVYPKCKSGFDNFGCCICRPNTPKCSDYNLNSGIDLSCAKKIKIGKPSSGSCGDGQQKDGGLCYKQCKTNYNGVGPVCWGQNPSGWVGCGMGSAKSSSVCASIVFDQVSSVGEMALSIATLGASSEATAAADAAQSAEELSALRKKFADLKKAYEDSKEMREVVEMAKLQVDMVDTATEAGDMASSDPETITAEDIVRLSAMIAALADPTGVAGTIAAYTYSKCSQIGV